MGNNLRYLASAFQNTNFINVLWLMVVGQFGSEVMILCLAFKSQNSFYDLNILQSYDMNKIRQTMGHYENRFGCEWSSTNMLKYSLMEAKH